MYPGQRLSILVAWLALVGGLIVASLLIPLQPAVAASKVSPPAFAGGQNTPDPCDQGNGNHTGNDCSPSPPATPTPTPTATPTPTPTATPTPTPTATPTPTPRATPTPTPTATGAPRSQPAAAQQSSTPASAPTPSPGTAAAPTPEASTLEPLLAPPPPATFGTPENTELAVSASQLLGDALSVAAGGQVSLAADVGHGQLVLAPDGSFTYRPDSGYIGPDAFEYVLTLGDQTSSAVEVTITVSRVDQPSPSPGDAFAIGSITRGGPNSPDVTFGSLGPLSFSFEWLIPSLVVSGPGLLILIVIGAQLLAGAAWLPLVRREVGDFGLGSPRQPERPM